MATIALGGAAWAATEAPGTYGVPNYNREKGLFTCDYNGHTVIRIQVEPGTDLNWRPCSDGCLVSTPLAQQLYFATKGDEPVRGVMTLEAPAEAICMRPRRAREGEAILSQVGHPLIKGVNGFYSVEEDLFINWSLENWRWSREEMYWNDKGSLCAEMEVAFTRVPWVINFWPRYYKEHLGYSNYEPWSWRPKTAPVAGWCSWLAYHQDITEEKIVKMADFLAQKFVPYGLEYLQIDDGFQEGKYGIKKDKTLADCWLEPIAGFPKGITNLPPQIAAKGLKPGVWMNTDIRTYDPPEGAHDAILRKKDGRPLHAPWITYANNCEDETLEATLAPLWKALSKSGYVYIKIDAIRHTFFDGLGNAIREGLIDTAEARRRFRNLFAVARREAGPAAFLLSCWSVYTESIGYVDACRVSTDTNPYWERMFLQQYEMARFWPLQRILFQVDPDHICSRTRRDWSEATLSTVSLCGGLFMISDPLESYDESLTHSIQRALPPMPAMPAETAPIDYSAPAYVTPVWTDKNTKDPIFEGNSGSFEGQGKPAPFGTLWAHHFACQAGRWTVVQRNALWTLPAAQLSMEGLGLDKRETYLAFDYWKGAFLGKVKGKLALPAMAVGSSQTICLRKRTGKPQLLGTSRHVSCGYVEIKSEKWNQGTKTLELQLRTQPEAYTLYVYLPDGFVPGEVKAENCACQDSQCDDGKVLRMEVAPSPDGDGGLKIKFKNTNK